MISGFLEKPLKTQGKTDSCIPSSPMQWGRCNQDSGSMIPSSHETGHEPLTVKQAR